MLFLIVLIIKSLWHIEIQEDSDKGKAVVGTVSGTSISFGTPVEFESGNTPYIRGTFDSSNNKVVIAYSDAVIATMVQLS